MICMYLYSILFPPGYNDIYIYIYTYIHTVYYIYTLVFDIGNDTIQLPQIQNTALKTYPDYPTARKIFSTSLGNGCALLNVLTP